jgi:hypothetical protein
VSDFIDAHAGDVAAYDAYCEAGSDEIDCEQCGDHHSAKRCPWADTCGECSRTDVEMADVRLCCDCGEELDRRAKRQQRIDDYEGHCDAMRDEQKHEGRAQ